MARPYNVTVEREECKTCHYGRRWAVAGPDGALQGTSYENENDAEEDASAFNNAYRLGYLDGYDKARGEA